MLRLGLSSTSQVASNEDAKPDAASYRRCSTRRSLILQLRILKRSTLIIVTWTDLLNDALYLVPRAGGYER